LNSENPYRITEPAIIIRTGIIKVPERLKHKLIQACMNGRRDEYLRIALNLTTPIWEEGVGEGKSEAL